MGLLDGKVAIVTGAGGGIGRAHALHFAKEGARVVVNDLGGDRRGEGRGTDMADKVVAEIQARGGRAVANHESVATREGADSLLWSALGKFGRVDILVNNAGILRDRMLLNMTDADWETVHAVHLRGTFLATQAVARHLKVQGQGGRIINTTSISGLMGNAGQANYAAAKAGIYGFTRTVALELARYRITCNAIAPIAYTRMTDDVSLVTGVPQASEVLSPEHISPVAVFLASELAADVSGAIIGVQGTSISIYRMVQGEGIAPRAPEWTPRELRERWMEITGAAEQRRIELTTS